MDRKLSQLEMNPANFQPGEAARIRRSIHSPYPGHTGVIMCVDDMDEKGAYLVMFSDGLQFRYKPRELEPLDSPIHSNVLDTLQRVVYETRQSLRWPTRLR